MRDRLLKGALKDRFVVTLVDGAAFEGLLYAVDEKTFELVDAFAFDGGAKQAVDGRLFIARDRVAYMQRP